MSRTKKLNVLVFVYTAGPSYHGPSIEVHQPLFLLCFFVPDPQTNFKKTLKCTPMRNPMAYRVNPKSHSKKKTIAAVDIGLIGQGASTFRSYFSDTSAASTYDGTGLFSMLAADRLRTTLGSKQMQRVD